MSFLTESRYNDFVGYTKNAISGFSWQSVLKVLQSVLTIVKVSILARLLSPNDFGVFSLVTIALGIVEAFTQTGVNFSILQSKRPIKYFVDTAWVIAIIRGILISICMVLLGLGMGTFYGMPELPLYIAIAAIVPLIKGFINPSIIMLHKKLEFFKDSTYRLSLTLVDVVLAIIFGIVFRSFIAMILAMIGAAIFEVVISFIFFSVKPKFKYIKSRAEIIYSNALWLSLSALLSYAHENIDNFILGKTIGTYNLGLYHNGYNLGHKTNYDLTKSAYHGTLPIFTKIMDDTDRLRRAFIKSSLATLGIAFLGTLPFFIFPKVIVSILLGSEWLSIANYLPLLATAGLLQAVSMQCTSLLMAMRKFSVVNLQLATTIIILVPLLIYWSNSTGIQGAAQALIISRVISLPIVFVGVAQVLRKKS